MGSRKHLRPVSDIDSPSKLVGNTDTPWTNTAGRVHFCHLGDEQNSFWMSKRRHSSSNHESGIMFAVAKLMCGIKMERWDIKIYSDSSGSVPVSVGELEILGADCYFFAESSTTGKNLTYPMYLCLLTETRSTKPIWPTRRLACREYHRGRQFIHFRGRLATCWKSGSCPSCITQEYTMAGLSPIPSMRLHFIRRNATK